jgi:hypothetical protein
LVPMNLSNTELPVVPVPGAPAPVPEIWMPFPPLPEMTLSEIVVLFAVPPTRMPSSTFGIAPFA